MKINEDTKFETILKIINKDGESITLTSDMNVRVKWYDSDEDITYHKNISIINIIDEAINFESNNVKDALYIKDIIQISII